MEALPLIDVGPLRDGSSRAADQASVGASIDAACRDRGFFLVTGHGIDPALRDELELLSREFFALSEVDKSRIAMERGGVAWRGWFPVGGELTSGRPDRKEGVYFGTELSPADPRVVAGTPLHGPNLFPAEPAGWRDVVLRWMAEVTSLGQAVLRGVAIGLGVDPTWFETHVTRDPTVLFRIFHYPFEDTGSPSDPGGDTWGVGEHTDYGLITLLAQDRHGGLQVRSGDGWLDVPADPYVFVVNIGDMLERLTGGRYRSTPHRVRNTSGEDRLSFPLFLDPSWDAVVEPLPAGSAGRAGRAGRAGPRDGAGERWDGQDVHLWEGPYGDYLTAKVAKVFPQLATALQR
jgi:isopenicillin N synthase-like dioxygenase